MTEKEIETLVELVAEKAAKKAINEAREDWQKDIRLHKAECTVGKFKLGFGFVCSVLGGLIVALANWLLRRAG